jgi:hypothetical protein
MVCKILLIFCPMYNYVFIFYDNMKQQIEGYPSPNDQMHFNHIYRLINYNSQIELSLCIRNTTQSMIVHVNYIGDVEYKRKALIQNNL